MLNMKHLFSAIIAAIALTFSAHSADMTNGVFYVNNPTECHLIAPSGATTTNQLSAGTTYAVGEDLAELEITNKTDFYFSGGTMIEAEPDSVFSINLFDQEVLNIDSTPTRAEFGTQNLSLMLTKGEYSIIYPNNDTNSSITVSTPYSSYQLDGGKYYFHVSDKSVIAYVLEGNMQVHDEKDRVSNTDKGKVAMAMPLVDPLSGISDKIITSIKPLSPGEFAHLSAPVIAASKKSDDVQFFIVGHQVIGIKLK
jgi:hypothetical protein